MAAPPGTASADAIVFDVPDDFVVEGVVGQGAFGAVCKSSWDGVTVAIKKIPHYSKSADTAKKVLREVEILQFFQYCSQIVACHYCFRPRSGDKDLYLVMDYVSSDLSSMQKKRVNLDEAVIRYIVCQLLLALRALHFYQIIHRDLSCRNILLNDSSQVMVCDFGLSRFFDPEEQLSFGVVTQWYRAPEIITDAQYDTRSDLFSIGVIMGELLLRKHLFPGKPNDPADQLHRVFSILGTPARELYDVPNEPYYTSSDNAKKYMEMYLFKKPTKSKLRTLPYEVAHSSSAMDLLEALLAFDPRKRPSADEALKSAWFDPLREFIQGEVATQDAHHAANAKFEATKIPQSSTAAEIVAMIEKMVPLYDRSVSDQWRADNAAAAAAEAEGEQEGDDNPSA